MNFSFFRKTSKLISLLAIWALVSPPLAYAGGGTYQLNIENGQIVSGNQINIVVTVTDNTKDYPYPLLVGEEFELLAHPESAGEGCVTTQKKTDQNGQFKGRCFSDQNGKFAFNIHSITRGDLPDSGAWEVYFQTPVPTTQPVRTTSPSPTVKASPRPSSSPKPVLTPTIQATASAQTSPDPTETPTQTALPEPEPLRNETMLLIGGLIGALIVGAGLLLSSRFLPKK
jgi:hypothetical protein